MFLNRQFDKFSLKKTQCQALVTTLYNYITDYIIETEQPQLHLEEDTLRKALPYEEEPITDEQWIIEYQREEAEAEERNNEFKQRLDGNKPIKSW